MPMPSWQYTIRDKLSYLPKSSLTVEELSDLHITLEEDDERSIRVSTDTSTLIDRFLTTSRYRGDTSIKCLPYELRTRPEIAKPCSRWISNIFTGWAQALCDHYSAKHVMFRRVDRLLNITGDARTKGIKTYMTGRNKESGHSISVIIRNRRQHEYQLCSVELYTLLTLADEKRLACPFADSYKVQIMVIHRHWIQRLSVQIPALYLISTIAWGKDLHESIHIHRTPWFNLMEDQGRRGALRAMFECFPLKHPRPLPPPPFLRIPPFMSNPLVPSTPLITDTPHTSNLPLMPIPLLLPLPPLLPDPLIPTSLQSTPLMSTPLRPNLPLLPNPPPTSTPPPIPRTKRKRDNNDDRNANSTPEDQRSQLDQLHISATPLLEIESESGP